MGIPKYPPPAKLFFGIIAQPEALEAALQAIEQNFGKIVAKSEVIPFSLTNYYADEMGENLLRQWVGVAGLFAQSQLADIKLRSNAIERATSRNGKRTMNLDPGFVLASKLILATTKDYSHRIYIGKGIFAEVTLIYKRKTGFQPLGWTYPDYKTDVALKFFNQLRAAYMQELRQMEGLLAAEL
ncbi:MAG: DUF4416 domain-containing protein [Candidatus Hydrothermota bacterium]|nr:MAG: DUF4416 domain-containing protein [Candidatus Hydrothermae bacterium]